MFSARFSSNDLSNNIWASLNGVFPFRLALAVLLIWFIISAISSWVQLSNTPPLGNMYPYIFMVLSEQLSSCLWCVKVHLVTEVKSGMVLQGGYQLGTI